MPCAGVSHPSQVSLHPDGALFIPMVRRYPLIFGGVSLIVNADVYLKVSRHVATTLHKSIVKHIIYTVLKQYFPKLSQNMKKMMFL